MMSAGAAGVWNVDLAETLDVSTVHTLYAELQAALDNGMPIVLNGSAVGRVDTAALQVLCSMFLHAGFNRCALEWRSTSEALVDSAKLLGVDKLIGLEIR
ncbi:MAG: STAS domain-containing protein [Gammaproteobacteria bacterium]|jgi:anti-anti-sigma regulatory factor